MNEEFDACLEDAKLHIDTTGRDDTHADNRHFPYEATTYTVLERLVQSGFLTKNDVVLDYGCGKGRVPIYLNHELGCKTIGIELVKDLYLAAVKNVEDNHLENVTILQGKAEKHRLSEEVTACFFFNPFSVELFLKVMKKIRKSYEACPRRIRLFFYYPQPQYISELMQMEDIEFFDEIDCMDLFDGEDSRNCIMIFDMK